MSNQPTTRNGNNGPVATTQAPAPTFNEAPASLNLRFNYKGFNAIQLTLRGESGTELLAKLDTVLGRLETMGATPTTNERGGAGQPQGAPAEAAPACPVHGPMKRSKKFNGWYCSHKLYNGDYCPEQVKD